MVVDPKAGFVDGILISFESERLKQLAPARRSTAENASVHTKHIFPHDSAASRAPAASLEPQTGAIVCNSLQ